MSRVQGLGLEMLMFADDLQRSEKDLEDFKRSLVASGNYDVEKLYAETETMGETTEFNNPDADYDFTAVEWQPPAESEWEEFERLQEELANDSVTLGEQNTVYGEWT